MPFIGHVWKNANMQHIPGDELILVRRLAKSRIGRMSQVTQALCQSHDLAEEPSNEAVIL